MAGQWRRRRLWLLPCLVLAAVTLPHLEQGDFRRDTGRYAAVGLYMWSGGSLARPYMNPETPYFNKPPLALLIHGFFLKSFGRHLAVARIPSVLAALGVLCFSVLIARRLGSRAEALVSGIVLALTYEFWRRTREISLDFWQLFFLMASAYLLVLGARRSQRLWLLAAGVPLGLALLCKPLVGLLMVPIFASWLLLLGRRAEIWVLLLGTLPIALLVALPWHWHMHTFFGPPFIRHYFGHEVVDRARGLLMTEPVYFYAATLAATYWPWALAAAWALYHRFRGDAPARRAGRDLVLLGSVWALFWLVALTTFPDRKPNYALPLYPALSWISAAGLCRLPWPALRRWYASRFAGLAPSAIAAVLILSLAPIQFQKPPNRDWATVFAWLKTNRIEHASLYRETMEPNDICYFYIKNGWWLPPWDSNRVSTAASIPAYGLNSTRDGQPARVLPDTVFQSGRIAVRSLRGPPAR